jgi:hypothetical protein
MSKNSAKGSMFIHISNGYVAAAPTLFPKDFDGQKKSCLTFTTIVNEGTDLAGKEYKSSANVKVFGPWAEKLAHMIDKGTAINMMGLLKTYAKPTGQIIDGKPVTTTISYLVAKELHVLPESAKKREENFNRNMNRLFAEGLVPETLRGVLTAQALLGHIAPTMTEFNAAACAGGRHGFARVWTKDLKFWDNGVIPTGTVGSAVSAAIPGLNMEDPIVKGILDSLKALTAAKVAATPVTPVSDQVQEIEPEIVSDMPMDVQEVEPTIVPETAMVAAGADDNIFNQA